MTNEQYTPSNPSEWRTWLQENHQAQNAIWLVMYKKDSAKHNLSWDQAVDQALCFGWIDSVKRPIDKEKFKQYFTKRKASSMWSKVNKDKVKKLKKEGLMAPAGLETIKVAKQTGMWNFLDEIDKLIIPEDLENALAQLPGSKDYFTSLSKSVRKHMLTWILMAKRPETRVKRIHEIAVHASKKSKPKMFQ